MRRAPVNYRPSKLSPEQRHALRQTERRFHIRAFGEELARVNLDLTLQERRRYLSWMRNYSRRNRLEAGYVCPPDAGPACPFH